MEIGFSFQIKVKEQRIILVKPTYRPKASAELINLLQSDVIASVSVTSIYTSFFL